MTRKSINAAVSAFALAAAASGPALAADPGATGDPIRIAMLEWTGAQITSQIAGRVLEKAGYKVEYVTAGNYPHFQGLADGEIAVSPENGMTMPSSRAAVSSRRVAVVPTATIRPPAARVALIVAAASAGMMDSRAWARASAASTSSMRWRKASSPIAPRMASVP